jgi:hypothetical protein
MENQTLGMMLGGRSTGLFINSKNEYCRVYSYYQGSTKRFQIIFSKELSDTATRPAINSTSEKKILKFLSSENFVIVKNI